jgi:outer membrane protein assembly factor BamB
VWKVLLQPGLSSIAVSGGRVFTLVRPPGSLPTTEYCVALDANAGDELWRTAVGVANYPNEGVGSDDGPRSTPSADGDRVYVLATYLNLLCLNATNGSVVWSNNLSATYGGTVIAWENAASPLIGGDLIFMNCNAPNNRLLAVRKSDGSEAWKGQNDVMTQASPVWANIAGVPQVIFLSQSGLVSVKPDAGTVIWRYDFPYNGVSTAASPVVGSNVVYCSSAYGTGAAAARVTGTGPQLTATQLWRKAGALQNHWCTPVHFEGHLYGMYGQSLLTFKCVELATGTEKWSRSGFGYGSALVVGGNILALNDSGELVLVAPNPDTYTEIARFRALTGKCWNNAAVSNGRIYVRSTTEAVCLDVAVPAPPPLRLNPVLLNDGSVFRLFIANDDGSAIDTNRAAKIGVFATEYLAAFANWTLLTNSSALTNGQLRFDDPEGFTLPRRFYRVEEQP